MSTVLNLTPILNTVRVLKNTSEKELISREQVKERLRF